MKKAAIITGYTCNNNCVFCYDHEKRQNNIPDLKTLDIKRMLKTAKSGGCTYVDFLGGEFTIRKDAQELISFAKILGFKTIAVTTNGRAFAYKKYLQTLKDAGLNSIIFSLHGHNAALHDRLTQAKGSFKQLITAIKNAKELGINIAANTTIIKQNLSNLPKIGELLFELGLKNCEFIFIDPTTGRGNTDFEKIVPGIKQSAEPIRKLLEIGKKNNIAHWHIRYYPMCYLEGYEDYVSEIHDKKAFENEAHFAPEFINTNVQDSRKIVGRVKAKQCKDCRYNDVCEGVWKKYAEKRGTSELLPVKTA